MKDDRSKNCNTTPLLPSKDSRLGDDDDESWKGEGEGGRFHDGIDIRTLGMTDAENF